MNVHFAMTEAVHIALINNIAVIVTIITTTLLSRLWSRLEHKDTAKKVHETVEHVREIKRMVNGDTDRLLKLKLEELRLAAIGLSVMAAVTKKPDDLRKATEAELIYEEARKNAEQKHD